MGQPGAMLRCYVKGLLLDSYHTGSFLKLKAFKVGVEVELTTKMHLSMITNFG